MSERGWDGPGGWGGGCSGQLPLDFFLPSFPIRTPLFTLLLTDGRWNVRGGRRERSVRENIGPCSQGDRSYFKSGSVLVLGDLARALTFSGPQLHSTCSEQDEKAKRYDTER